MLYDQKIISIDEAVALQLKYASKIKKEDQIDLKIRMVAGVDVAYKKNSDQIFAAAVVLDADSLVHIETATAEGKVKFPYIPGLFSFREIPIINEVLSKLSNTPDLIVCDGHGIAHPRRFGIASHLGLMHDLPTIGCGKTKLIGKHNEPGLKRGDKTPLLINEENIGTVLRTQDGINPVYVSIGHKISLLTACDWVIKLSPKYRLPETTRLSDQMANSLLKTSY